MYCKECGKKISKDSKFCEYCGNKIQDSKLDNSQVNDKKIGRWSWGAFGLTWIYFVSMKYKFWWLFLIGMIIANGIVSVEGGYVIWVGLIIQLTIMIYAGAKGRQLAWDNRQWENIEHFKKTQKVWDIWGVILFLLFNAISFFAAY